MRMLPIASLLFAATALFAALDPAVADKPDQPRTVDESASFPSVTRIDPCTFQISRFGSFSIRLNFLGPRTFHMDVTSERGKGIVVPEYMLVKADASYPQEHVDVEGRDHTLTFTTPGASVDIAADGDLISVTVRSPAGPLIRQWKINPTRRTAELDLLAGEHIYGFGDKRAALDQHGHRVEILNRDAFASETNDSYKSIPFYISSAGYGLFLHNFYPSMFDIGASVKGRLALEASAGNMDFYIFIGEPKDILAQYTQLTGYPAMLPRWAFGYHQGKATYRGRQALAVAEVMRQRKLPFDVIYYDNWSEEATTKEFIEDLWYKYHARLTLGFGMPMFGIYGGGDDSALVRELAAHRFLMVDQNNQPVIGADEHVDKVEHPSWVGYLDFFSPQAVNHVFEAKWNRAITSGAILGMVDFGELDHLPNAHIKYWPSLGGISVEKTRNLFGLVYPLSVVGGVHQRTGTRGTGMIRPGFAGSQRIGWSTTGDSLASYRNFRAHTRALLNLTLSGFSNVGQDIGGWDHKGADPLYARWFAAGTFYPFMWSHGQGDHEPYAHGATVESAARQFLDLRYRLVPYLYSLHELAHRTGVPVLRSLPLQESDDPDAYRIDDQFFLGNDLLVAPVFNDEGDREVYLPKGLWYDFFAELSPERGGRKLERIAVPLDRIPVYVRSGAVIPLGPPMQYTGEKPVNPLVVHVYGFPDADVCKNIRRSQFALYEDDGFSSSYLQGRFQRTHLRFQQTQGSIRFEVDPESGDGSYRSLPGRSYQLQFHGVPDGVRRVQINGRDVRGSLRRLFRPVAHWSQDRSMGGVSVFVPRQPQTAKVVVDIATQNGSEKSNGLLPGRKGEQAEYTAAPAGR